MTVAAAASPARRILQASLIAAASLLVLAALAWQAVTSGGNPDPLAQGIGRSAAVLNASVLVFREGLEAVLVLAALTASLVRSEKGYWKPVALGSGLSFLASIATWFVMVALMSSIDVPALDIQAGTGLLAIAVLLVIMNWFFHRIYWSGWIVRHNRWKQSLIGTPGRSRVSVVRGLVVLGFTCVYREGFEIVLFLQSVRLRAGNEVVLGGLLIGLGLTLIVAVLTFVAHTRLPYRRMLVFTGVMLGAVLLVMVGESVQEMQQAGWLSTTKLALQLPAWLGTWFALLPNAEGLGAQVLAALIVAGSYFLARRRVRLSPARPSWPSSAPTPCAEAREARRAPPMPT
jgi:high-affinity iron transporter